MFCCLSLGAGGMGEVYRAHDSKLGRDVAVKTLPQEFARDPDRLSRLRREARTLAFLNHPNIAAIYGLEESDEADFLVMELVEGEMLRGPLPVHTALERAGQVAAALEAAHERGIIHRDLKLANVKVTPQGRVKVLDFGLAKAIWRPEGNQDLSRLATVTGMESVAGQIVGTPGYMSPEQARGRDVDKRTDIWAFGCLLYELLTGKRAFPGETLEDTITAVLEREPNWQALPAKTPAPVRGMLRHCLQKDASLRVQNIADARRTIENAQQGWNRWQVAAIGAAALAALAFGAALWPRSVTHLSDAVTQSARVQVLAVLPLENLSRDSDQEYFADGMTEALINELGKISKPRVISRQSVMQYKGSHKSLPEIARELKADAILGGAVERSGDRVRINVHLEQAYPERQLWTKQYDRSIRDVLTLQDEIARTAADEIQAKLTPEERTRLAVGHPVDPEAQDNYLRGLYFSRKFSEQDSLRAISLFKAAIAKDPTYAPAYTELANIYLGWGSADHGGPSAMETMPLARAAVTKALQLDPSLARAHLALAAILLRPDWNWAGAEDENRLALKLSPNCGDCHFAYGVLLSALGRFPEALAQLNQAIQIDPLSSDYRGFVAGVYIFSHQYDLCIKLSENLSDDWMFLPGMAYAMKGMYPEAIAYAEKGVARPGGRLSGDLGRLALIYGLAGRKDETRKIIRELKERSRHRYVFKGNFGDAYLGLGDKQQSITWFERSYEEQDPGVMFLNVAPNLDPLRSEPRFQALLRRMNFPQ